MGFVDLELESFPAYQDFVPLPLFALFYVSIRLLLDRSVFQKIGRRIIFGSDDKMLDVQMSEKRKKKKIRKFKESAWKCVYFSSAELLALFVTYNEPWFTSTRNFWVGPGDQVWPDQKTKGDVVLIGGYNFQLYPYLQSEEFVNFILKLKGLYMYGSGFYSYLIFALIFWETRRSDFGVSMGHHIASVILIVLSHIFRFARVDYVVLVLHDASDVFLQIGKMSKYGGYETVKSRKISDF